FYFVLLSRHFFFFFFFFYYYGAHRYLHSFPTRRSSDLLSVPQLSGAGSIWQSKIFLNDLTANLNQSDFVNGQETLDLRGEKNFADRKSTRLNSSHRTISYAVFCLKKKKKK